MCPSLPFPSPVFIFLLVFFLLLSSCRFPRLFHFPCNFVGARDRKGRNEAFRYRRNQPLRVRERSALHTAARGCRGIPSLEGPALGRERAFLFVVVVLVICFLVRLVSF